MRRGILLFGLVAAFASTPAAAAVERTTPTGAAEPGLMRATPVQVRARLGEPAVANTEGAGALWTYRLERCALMVFFKDEGGGLRVSGLAAGPRRRGEAPVSVAACLGAASRP